MPMTQLEGRYIEAIDGLLRHIESVSIQLGSTVEMSRSNLGGALEHMQRRAYEDGLESMRRAVLKVLASSYPSSTVDALTQQVRTLSVE